MQKGSNLLLQRQSCWQPCFWHLGLEKKALVRLVSKAGAEARGVLSRKPALPQVLKSSLRPCPRHAPRHAGHAPVSGGPAHGPVGRRAAAVHGIQVKGGGSTQVQVKR